MGIEFRNEDILLESTNGSYVQDERTSSLEIDSDCLATNSNANLRTNYATLESIDETISQHNLDTEAIILKRQVETIGTRVGLLAIHRYATTGDLWIISISCIMSIISGVTMPLMILVFGNVQSALRNYFNGISVDDFEVQINQLVIYFVYLAIAAFIATYTYTVGFIYTGENITVRIRAAYLENCLRQNIAFFDSSGAGEIVTRISVDTNLIQEGISQKLGLTIAGVSTFFAAFVVGFITYWKLTLILLPVLVAVLLNMTLGSRFTMKYSRQMMDAYIPAASLADEVINSIRNTVAFGTQNRMALNFEKNLKISERYGFRAKVAMGLMAAGTAFIVNLGYGLAFWVGGQYVVYEGIPVSKVLITVMSSFMGAFSLGNVTNNAQAFVTGLTAVQRIYDTIDRQSPLDPFEASGKRLHEVKGTLELKNVKHVYPSRPEVVVLDDVSLKIPERKTTALVGASGSGKSTVIGLIERFYEPIRGDILLDGHEISTLNLRWLRRQVSLVSQEPTLFNISIFNNIKHGLVGTEYEHQSEEAQRIRVFNAAKKANAHAFISGLPEGYETQVGATGSLLSGGQKQRIAIARAIVSDPKVLLLDEATSALDTKSEGIVQEALIAASEGRTTLVIAHRLSTIKNADNIIVLSKGKIAEQGTHDELLENQGPYHALVAAQNLAKEWDDAPNGKDYVDSNNEESTKMSSLERTLTRGTAKSEHTVLRTSLQGSINSPSQQVNSTPTRYSLYDMAKLIISFNHEEKTLLVIGVVFCVICGSAVPVQATFLAKAISTLSTPLVPSNLYQVKKESDFWAVMYLMLGCVLGLANAAHGVLFAKCAERLTRRARFSVFRSILHQDIAFFDEPQNTAGGLTTFLSTKTADVAGLSGVTLGSIVMSATTLVAGLVVGIAIGWKLGIVCASTIPILLANGYCQVWVRAHFTRRSIAAYTESASYASEAISAIRTVASLTREEEIISHYRGLLEQQQGLNLRSVSKSSLLVALAEALTLLIFALCFWWGSTLITKGEYTMFQFFVCFASVIFGAQSSGYIFSHGANMSKAYVASQELQLLFDRKPSIDTWSTEGEKISNCEGRVEFRDVHFHYPTRPQYPVLSGINIDIHPGQYVAFVGSSGCGKSTSISLLERFYNPIRGGIFVDGKDIASFNVNHYRSLIALVSQEPTLYQGTIRENILLGTSNHETISEDSIIQACQDANIYNFITSLPDSFNTMIGGRGVLLSGGQKQRIAIARALIRNPRILLLDEATSALDTESETVVQLALDKAANGRTTIALAHRLSTIKKADMIYVFDQGQITEKGTYTELVRRNGRFAELVAKLANSHY